MASNKKTILVIMGTVRENRSSKVVADWVMRTLPQDEQLEYELVDLKDWQLPFFDEPQSPMMTQGNHQNEIARAWAQKAKDADGFILITAEYNHSIPAVLKNALDYWYSGSVQHKPVGFVSYGAISGGIRAVEHLRQIVAELRLIGLHDEVNIPLIWEAFDEKGEAKNSSYADRLRALASELSAWFSK